MAKLEAELDEAGLLVTPSNPTPRAFLFSDIGKLHYLDHVIKVCHILAIAVTLLVAVASRHVSHNLSSYLPNPSRLWAFSYACNLAIDEFFTARLRHSRCRKIQKTAAACLSVYFGLVSQPLC